MGLKMSLVGSGQSLVIFKRTISEQVRGRRHCRM